MQKYFYSTSEKITFGLAFTTFTLSMIFMAYGNNVLALMGLALWLATIGLLVMPLKNSCQRYMRARKKPVGKAS